MQALTRETWKVYWQHVRRYKFRFYFMILGIAVVTTTDILKPFLYRSVIDTMAKYAGRVPDVNAYHDIQTIVWYIVLAGLFGQTWWRSMGYVNNRFQPRIMSELLNSCYGYMQKHSAGFFNDNFVGSIVTRIRRFSGSFEAIDDQLKWNIGRTAFMCLAMLIVLAFKWWLLACMFLAWVVVYITFTLSFARFKLKYDLALAAQDSKVTGYLADSLGNHSSVSSFAIEKSEYNRFAAATQALCNLRTKSWDLGQLQEVLQGGSMVILEFIVLMTATRYWYMGVLTGGEWIFVNTYLRQLFDHVWDIGRTIRSVYEALANANEMSEMLVKPHGVVDSPAARELCVTRGSIEFSGINFQYNQDAAVFSDFHLRIRAGEKVAVVGKSGEGKTTLVKLLQRSMDIHAADNLATGQIWIDGQDIAEVTQESLRRSIALVPQDPSLFHRSIMENIRLARLGATDQEVKEAATRACCHEFIDKLPNGYNTVVGERGVKLSGGQRQRIAIACAILKDAPILILDEATCSLDSKSERYIQASLEAVMQGRTTIVVAHRLSTIKSMDRIVMLENGVIVEEGNHKYLLGIPNGKYRALWEMQAGEIADVVPS